MAEKLQKIPVSKILVEMISIIFAVLVALAVNQWQAARNDRQLAADAIEQIISEIRRNRELLSNYLSERNKTLEKENEQITQLEKTYGSIDYAEIKKRNIPLSLNFSSPLLTKTAWEAAIITHAVKHMDFNTVRAVSNVYEIQELFAVGTKKHIDEVAAEALFKGDSVLPHLQWYLTRVEITLGVGQQLLQTYDAFLKKKSPG